MPAVKVKTPANPSPRAAAIEVCIIAMPEISSPNPAADNDIPTLIKNFSILTTHILLS